jgi:HPt (histidine-containing phosphotransfer) domain-containing protein
VGDIFAERLAAVRKRFAANLDTKMRAIAAAAPALSGADMDTANKVATVHHLLHELCGLAPTVGFPQTGQAARSMEQILRPAVQGKRGLNAQESAAFQHGLEKLGMATQSELHGAAGAAA